MWHLSLTEQHLGDAGAGGGAEEAVRDGVMHGADVFDEEGVAVGREEAVSQPLQAKYRGRVSYDGR